jgi:hypothetical protein|tara:strand:- start:1097 stop:1543 length:447 start_codon:yes stop_codon:yes gene_type:complete
MEKFLDLFVHHWHNLRQAQHSPASFAYVHYEVTWDGEQLKTKQWYDYEGPDKPYRERQHNVSDMEDGKVLLETFNNFVKLADTIFVPTPEGFRGQTEDGYFDPQGRRVETKVTLTNTEFATSDKGWDRNGNLLWGSEKGPFVFNRCTK